MKMARELNSVEFVGIEIAALATHRHRLRMDHHGGI